MKNSSLSKIGLVSLTLLLGLASAPSAFAWGERGHHLICEVATRLVKADQLRAFLSSRGDILGHVCNIPDIYWRDLGPIAKSGDDTHFMNPEKLGYTVATVPLDFAEIVRTHPGQDVPAELGSDWWRAEQFYRRALEAAEKAGTSAPPNHANEQNHSHPYNAAVYAMVINLGLMGHFVGDASQPYHNTDDYDGWNTGHGGIHSYYESSSVNALGFNLIENVFQKASQPLDISGKPTDSILQRMKSLTMVSAPEIAKITALDQVIEPSQNTIGPDGKPHRVPAKRIPAEAAAKAFEPLITTQMARSAQILAEFWDRVYLGAGSPDLSKYKIYAYPLTPDFVAPDYTDPPRSPSSIKKTGHAKQ